MRTTSHEFISSLREKVLSGTLTRVSAGSMLFSENGICITEDAEEEFVRPGTEVTFVETEYAQQLSWVFRQFKEGIPDVILEASVLACQTQYINQQNLRDEVLACAASLTDVAEKL